MKIHLLPDSRAHLPTILFAAVFSLTSWLSASVVSANVTESADDAAGHRFELAKEYHGDCLEGDDEHFDTIRPYLKAFTDMEVMAEMMADPNRFAQLVSVVNDPRTIHVMTKCATEPVMWNTWMNGLTDFNKMTRTMVRLMNPNIFMSWMMAPMNPGMYQPMMQVMNPEYYNRWMAALMNPVFYQPVTSLTNPAWYAPRIQWMMNPMMPQSMMGGMVPGMQNSMTPPDQSMEQTGQPESE